ncbi:ABC transporter ATP-binding protein [Peribacillus sp. SCS-37]|uniref:ABC transporter ATP-binding protein n=1 Tax=Paraperibacillus esterisolvens TaxID=3115296 RepID=UPI003905BE66
MRQLWYFIKQLVKVSGNKLYVNMAGMVLVGLFESFSLFLLIPLLGISGILPALNNGYSEKFAWMAELLQPLSETAGLILILSFYLLLMLCQSLFQRSQLLMNMRIQQGFAKHLKNDTYQKLIYANWGFYLRKRKSDIINSMTTEISRVSAGTTLFLQMLSSLLFTMVQIGAALWLSYQLTIFVVLFGASIIFVSRKFLRRSHSYGSESVKLSQTYLAGVTDHFNGIKEIKSNGLEKSHINWINGINQKTEENIMNIMKISTVSQALFKILSAVLITVFVFFAIKLYKADTASLILIMVIFSRLWPRFSGIQSNLEQVFSILPAFKELMDLQRECEISRENIIMKEAAPLRLKDGIECSHVYFSYNQGAYALKDITITFPANHMTAIVGKSGAGKSTLIDLLMGLNMPGRGEVRVDGKTLTEESLGSLRSTISYVPQDPFLFNGTIRDNLMAVKQDATEEDIWNALIFSSAAEFVKNLPKGLDTLIGDRGVRLSGGERQRLVIARAVLRKPSILILDEATSALDSANEENIQESLQKLKGQITIIVIAHRLSTIRNADQVVVLEEGRIVQSGGYKQLANEKSGRFQELLLKQMG